MIPHLKGREKEAVLIKNANKAVAVGRLMLGEINDWQEFLEPETIDYSQLPRRQLKSGKFDVQNRLNKSSREFFNKNFQGFNQKVLLNLYEDLKGNRGLELPLSDFEAKYGKVNPSVLKGNPTHLTVVISLWGLQFLFPEDLLTKDIVFSLELLKSSLDGQLKYLGKKHTEVSHERVTIRKNIQQQQFAQRTIVFSCFNLLEAFLNGLAWDYCQKNEISTLSKRTKELLRDTSSVSIRDKLLKYPKIIGGIDLSLSKEANDFLEVIKPFRDSLVHPSPFSAPEKFGGYSKLRKIYDLNDEVAINTFALLCKLLNTISYSVFGEDNEPKWLKDLNSVRVSAIRPTG